MKLLSKLFLALFLFPIFVNADTPAPPPVTDLMTQQPNPATDNISSDLARYLLNLGLYLGFDLTKSPAELSPEPIIRTLIKISEVQTIETFAFGSLLGAMPVNSLLPQFLPKSAENAAAVNPFANATFQKSVFNSPNPDKISVNASIDQQQYQNDPINQGILNLLGIADTKFCKGEDPSKCEFLYTNKILTAVIGNLPKPTADITDAFYGYNYIKGLLGQLNSNSLIGPLRYASEAAEGSEQGSKDIGLTGKTQAAQAENFIRYASGTLVPPKFISYDDYKNLYNDATNTDPKFSAVAANAKEILATYFASFRTYTARTSVGLGNLYYILSKRMEQDMVGGKTSSQAESEFNMATRRIFIDPNKQQKTWVEQISDASSATVEKEIALLLAEINYQLYLNRQQEERMLMTQSLMLLTSIRPPENRLTQAAASEPAGK